jgi:hypothetical protein
MAGNYLGRAGAYALHKKYPTGSQTPSQLAAERANLQKARMARGQFRHTKSAWYRGIRKSTLKSRESAAAVRVFNLRDIQQMRARALGVRYMRYKSKAKIPKPMIRGIPKKFVKNVGPAAYMGRTRWSASRKHKMRKRLFKREHRFHGVKRWKYRGKRFTPR